MNLTQSGHKSKRSDGKRTQQLVQRGRNVFQRKPMTTYIPAPEIQERLGLSHEAVRIVAEGEVRQMALGEAGA